MSKVAITRIVRLEALAKPRGCDVCHLWGPCVYQFGDDGTHRPETCPNCGREVPIRLIRLMHINLDIDDEPEGNAA